MDVMTTNSIRRIERLEQAFDRTSVIFVLLGLFGAAAFALLGA